MKRMQLDGVVFNVREEVTAQIFCTGQTQSKAYKIKNSGIVNLPAGCTFSVTDKEGKKTSIKSLPLPQMIEFKPVDIIVAGPEQIFKQNIGGEAINSTSGLTRIINAHLSSLSNELLDTSETIKSQRKYVIILATFLGLTLIISLIIGGLLYRYSTRFKQKVLNVKQELIDGFESAKQKFHAIEEKVIDKASNEFAASFPGTPKVPPPVPPHSLNTILFKLEQLEERIRQSDSYLNIPTKKDDPIYQNMSESHYSSTPRNKPKMYPPLQTPEDLEQAISFIRGKRPDPTAPILKPRPG